MKIWQGCRVYSCKIILLIAAKAVNSSQVSHRMLVVSRCGSSSYCRNILTITCLRIYEVQVETWAAFVKSGGAWTFVSATTTFCSIFRAFASISYSFTTRLHISLTGLIEYKHVSYFA